MKLDRNSRLVKFAYSLDSERAIPTGQTKHEYSDEAGGTIVWHETVYTTSQVPLRTTLCRFFWRAFVFVPIAYVTIVPFLWIISMIAMGFSMIPTGTVGARIADKFDAAGDYLSDKAFAITDALSPIGRFFVALKNQVCPIIELK